MCVIVAKPAGIPMPDTSKIEDMWYTNPDGAGFMYAKDGTVYIRKGFMDLDDFLDAIDDLADRNDLTSLPVVMHFRITTHGGTRPENCHPFPISDSVGVLSKPECRTKLGVAHNGIIPITPRKDISDTMEYIISQLAPLHRAVPAFYRDKDLMQMIYNAVRSKLAFLTDKGEIYTVGDFYEKDGIKYSNLNHEWTMPRNFKFGCAWGSTWDDYDTYDSYLGNCYTIDSDGKTLGSYRNQLVMWVDEDLGYASGVEGDDIFYGMYALDANNEVYLYDDDVDALVRVPGATLYSNTGTTIRFNKKSASCMTEVVFEPNKKSGK